MTEVRPYREVRAKLLDDLVTRGLRQEVGEWHAQDVSGVDSFVFQEICQVNFAFRVRETKQALITEIQPNLPWAEDHFQERVGGEPLNPPPSESYWPFAQDGNKAHKAEDKFSHTYPERYWPGRAGQDSALENWNRGIRFAYGDLNDLVRVLTRNPMTRQAYLPVWFPEDLNAAVLSERVPCSIGYHFLMRAGQLDCFYNIRSCEILRHFTDDMYMAARLLQWVVGELEEAGVDARPGNLHVHINSLHYLNGDSKKIKELMDIWEVDQYAEAI